MIISVAEKARIRKNCKEVRRVMYIRCRLIGSWDVWFWLAKIIRGRSQHERIKRGVDRGSVAKYGFRKVHPVSEVFFSHIRLVRAIKRLFKSEEGHSHLGGVSHVASISMVVGIRIFNIVGDLSFVGGLIHGCGL